MVIRNSPCFLWKKIKEELQLWTHTHFLMLDGLCIYQPGDQNPALSLKGDIFMGICCFPIISGSTKFADHNLHQNWKTHKHNIQKKEITADACPMCTLKAWSVWKKGFSLQTVNNNTKGIKKQNKEKTKNKQKNDAIKLPLW